MHYPRDIAHRALRENSLHGRMSFIAGPRQIGKTTLLQRFLKEHHQSQLYYNWDTAKVKRRYAVNPDFFVEDIPGELKKPWIAFDEIHKYPKWKNILKGYYDEYKQRAHFAVTGSARLDFLRRSGDSLAGRYFLFKMLPLGIKEILKKNISTDLVWAPTQSLLEIPLVPSSHGKAVKHLLEMTGFPEPFSVGTKEFYNRWRDNYISLTLQEDLRDLTKIIHVRKLETLLYLLPERVSSPLSLNSLCSPLECAHGSIRLWLNALELVYLIFSIPPWTARLSHGVRKEKKFYSWDWGMVEDPGKRFENFLAVQLRRMVEIWNEQGKGPFQVYFLRMKDGREVDFAVGDRKKIWFIVEAKHTETSLTPHIAYFQNKLDIPYSFQVINKPGFCQQKGKNAYILGIDRFLNFMP